MSKLSHDEGISHTSESGKNSGYSAFLSPGQTTRAGPLSQTAGANLCSGGGDSTGSPQGLALAEMAEYFQPQPSKGQARQALDNTVMYASSTSMAGLQTAIQADTSVHRCLPDRLGSSMGGQNGKRCLGASLGHRTHQCTGTKGSISGPPSSSSVHTQQACPGEDRQFFLCVPYQPLGGHKISAVSQGGAQPPVLGPSSSSLTQGCLHTRDFTSGSRPSFQEWASPRVVETAPGGGGESVGSLWLWFPALFCLVHSQPCPL